MLGRMVAARLAEAPPEALFSEEVVAVAREADLFVLNLECAISDRGEPWPDPLKPFFFRAPPVAVRALTHLGVSCVNLANNHALDYGRTALLDTLEHLAAAGIAAVGAGPDEAAARAPAVLGGRGGAAGSRAWASSASPTIRRSTRRDRTAPGSPTPTSARASRAGSPTASRACAPGPRRCWSPRTGGPT